MSTFDLKTLLTEVIEIGDNNKIVRDNHSTLFPKTVTDAWNKHGDPNYSTKYHAPTGEKYKNVDNKKKFSYRNLNVKRGIKTGFLSSGRLVSNGEYCGIVFLGHGQGQGNGIYPMYSYCTIDKKLYLLYGQSVNETPMLSWKYTEKGKDMKTGKDLMLEDRLKVSRVYKSYDTTDIAKWDYTEMLSELDDIIDDFEITLGITPTLRANGESGTGTGNVVSPTKVPAKTSKTPIIPDTLKHEPTHTSVPKTPNPTPSHPLNLILYGPPGTGKTYNTLFHALSIIYNKSIDALIGEKCPGKSSKNNLTKEEYKLFKDDFDKKVEEGQIVFTTFHQSMSYEDFIEGIKPIPKNDPIVAEHKNDSESKSTLFGDGATLIKNLSRMKYEVKDGIFKQICGEASKPGVITHPIVLKDVIDYFCFDYEKFGSHTEVSRGSKKFSISALNETIDGRYKSIELSAGTEKQSIQLDVIRRDYDDYKAGKIKSDKDIKPSRSSKSVVHGNAELCFGLLQKIKEFEDNKYKEYTDGKIDTSAKKNKDNYVLIIDEINRGNVAQIFGELITLIEPSKRLDNNEEMKAVLPYSSAQKGKPVYFGVPNNLYIIGTMNTADRSVEALDTALRRRFSFEEMMPKPELLEDKELCGVKLSYLLKTINDRIIALKDREHQIGHSYFMGRPDDDAEAKAWITDVFKDKIIPLLQEYFYGDYKKIYYVLGPGFVKEVSENKPEDIFPVKIDDDLDIDQSMTRYEIKSFDEEETVSNNKVNIFAAVNRLVKSTNDKDKLVETIKGKKYKDISIGEVVERLLSGEDESLFEEVTEASEPKPES